MSGDVENPTPLARPGPVQAWEYMGVEGDEEDAYLRDLAGVDKLDDVSSLRLSVNTSATTISHLGAKLPHLQELNLTGSVIESIRDLGTGFQGLQVLWVSRCGLPSLDGLSALPVLRELYAAYNDISDLQPLDSCQLLEVLDIEGNCIDDTEALHALSAACPRLQSLTLTGNPVASSPGYHAQVTSLLRSLSMLDDLPIEHHADQAPMPAASGAQPSSDQDQELQLVREGIKHARVGVDSQEFRELEMTLLMAAELPTDANGAPLPTPTMLPASASSWLRCSQQGSLPSMQRARSQRSEDAGGASSRGSSRGGGGGASRPESSGAAAYPPGSPPHPQRLSSGSARPPSARPGTASLLSNRPSTSAPPTAGMAGGLYWKKNRLSAVRPHGSGGTGGSGAADDEDDDGVTAGSILTFGVSKGATMGASLARDLRRRKTAAATASAAPPDAALGGGPQARQQATSAPGAAANSGASGAAGLSVSCSYDPATLLQELRRWKVETADRVLLASEDEASGTAWLNAEDDEQHESTPGDRGSSIERVSAGGRLPAWQESGVEGRAGDEGDEGGALPSGVRVGGAEVLSISATRAGPGEQDDPTGPPGPPLASVSVQPRQGLTRSPPSAGLPPTPLSPSGASLLSAGAVSSPSGKPPLAPLGPARNGKLALDGSGSSATPPASARGQPSSVASPSGLLSPARHTAASAAGTHPSFPVQGLGPVHGHRPARPSKMLLCKVLFDTSGRVLLTNHHSRHSVNGAGQESLSIKSRPLGSVDPFLAHANPLFTADSEGGGGGGGAERRAVMVVSCCGEIDIRAVNPTPVQHIQDDGDSSDDDLLADL